MKKLVFTFALLCLCVTVFVGCRKELQETRGKVTHVELEGDTVVSTLLAVEKDTLYFKLADARFTNGMIVPGDSVIINYIEGREDTLRALVVTILPKAPHFLDLDADTQGDTLVTSPVKPEDQHDPLLPEPPAAE